MKYFSLVIVFILSAFSINVEARTVEADVHGMTCELCVDTLEQAFKKMDSVTNVDVSLEENKIRLQTVADKPDLELIKQTILDAGFTPVKVSVTAE